MYRRGLLLCNLARQGINASSSDKQVLSKEEHSQISHKVFDVVPQEDNSKHNERDLKVLQWLNETSEQVNKITDNAEESTEQLDNIDETIGRVKEITDNVNEIINHVKEGNTTGETSQSGQIITETGSESKVHIIQAVKM